MTFPAHTSHLFQPLDVGVYKSLKSVWAKLLNNHILLNPNNMPSRSHFHELFTPAFLESFTPLNIIHSFKKAGACPYNPNVLPAEALAPSRLTDRYGPSSPATRVRKSGLPCDLEQTLSTLSPKDPSEEQLHGVEVPHAPKQTTSEVGDMATKGAIKRKKTPQKEPRDSSAKCLNPPERDKMDQPKPGTPKDRPAKPDDDWKCGLCSKLFSEDVKKKNGAQWLQCSFCKFPYHEKCQKNPTKELIYMCDACEPFYGSEDTD
ncbi:hypothetical protein J6590_007026 [Homalodisca vitripennis]|nr:hypothetical protein J6590_007026 [Homalodisca vitripennis]